MGTPRNTEDWASLGVPPVIIKALLEQNFRNPTAIQSLSLPPAIFGKRDILGAAETGSGKTLAFGIPVLKGILDLKEKSGKAVSSTSGIFKETSGSQVYVESDSDGDDDSLTDDNNESVVEEVLDKSNKNGIGLVQVRHLKEKKKPTLKKPLYALILTPTRELAIQIKNHLVKAAKYTDIQIAVVVGGMAAVKQERLLKRGPEIVIATPGRLWELIEERNPHLSQIGSLRYLVIDETDRMLERGHFEELHDIIERINVKQSNIMKRQTFVFSATLTLVHDIPDYLKNKKIRNSKSKIFKLTSGQKLQRVIEILKVKNPKIIDVTRGTGTAANLTECRIACTSDHKDYYLYYFLQKHPGRTLVFCNSIGCVKRLATLFGILGFKPLPLHASMPQRQRLKNLERFEADNNGLLIATDVAARGLDIPNIEHVIHYQVPRTSESYVHRSGRTARADKEGITLVMMEPSEKQFYSRLCKTLNRTEDLPTFPVIDRLLVAVKERVNVAREIDKMELTCRRDNSQKGWLQKAAKEMDILLDDEECENGLDAEEKGVLKKTLKNKRSQLDSLLKKPLFPKNFSGKYLDANMEVSLSMNPQTAIEAMKNVAKQIPKSKKESVSKVPQNGKFVPKRKLKCEQTQKAKKIKVN